MSFFFVSYVVCFVVSGNKHIENGGWLCVSGKLFFFFSFVFVFVCFVVVFLSKFAESLRFVNNKFQNGLAVTFSIFLLV